MSVKTTPLSEAGVVILVFPFAAPNVLAIATKQAAAIRQAVTKTVVVGGKIPADLAWPNDVETRDIGVRLHYLREIQPKIRSITLWIAKFLATQILLARELFRLRNEIDTVICFMGIYYQLPILLARLLRKRVLSTAFGIYSAKARSNYGRLISFCIRALSLMSYKLSHDIIVESWQLASHRELRAFRDKLVNGAMFLENPTHFCEKTRLSHREQLVGFVGRFVAEKGILPFIESIPLVVEQRPEVQFLIIGTGIQDEAVQTALQDNEWSAQVTWLKQVVHDSMPIFLNRMRLLVMPSLDEGLPNLLLEAMGCGTPVLATAVGGIPDLIVEGRTGFILTNTKPETIAQSILLALEHNSQCLADNARLVVEAQYNLDAATERYNKIINEMA